MRVEESYKAIEKQIYMYLSNPKRKRIFARKIKDTQAKRCLYDKEVIIRKYSDRIPRINQIAQG